MALTISASFTAVGAGQSLSVKHGDSFAYTVSGTFSATWVLEKSQNNFISAEQVATGTGTASSISVYPSGPVGASTSYRFRCSAYTSGTMVTSMVEGEATEPVQELKTLSGQPIFTVKENSVLLSPAKSLAYYGGENISQKVNVSGTVDSQTAEVANGTTVETDLHSFTVPANMFFTNGDSLEFVYFGTFAANSNNKTIQFYTSGTSDFTTGTLTNSNTDWEMRIYVHRTSSTVVKGVARFTTSSGTGNKVSYIETTGLDWSAALIFKLTGQSGAASSDIILRGAQVRYFPAELA